MPTYEYACKKCGEHLEVVQSFRDDALTTCPSCGGELRKVFGNIGVTFKGSGFYKTDSRPRPKEGSSGDGGSRGSSSESKSSDSKSSDSKSSASTSTESKSSDSKSGSKGSDTGSKSSSAGRSGSSGSSGSKAAAS